MNRWLMRFNPWMYQPEHRGDERWSADIALRADPPTNLILGKCIWGAAGAMAALGYSNRQSSVTISSKSTGIDPVGGVLLDNAGLRERFLLAEAAAKHYKAIGIEHVFAYVGWSAAYGDPVERTGFWAFRDSPLWQTLYRQGPDEDPARWMSIDAEGKPVPYYDGATMAPGHCAPWKRFQMCWNQPGWRHWLKRLAIIHALLGLDVFWDNCYSRERPTSIQCFCDQCRKRGIGPNNPDELNDQLRTDSLCEALDEVWAAGKRARRDFRMVANSNAKEETHAVARCKGIFGAMFENKSWDLPYRSMLDYGLEADLLWTDYAYMHTDSLLIKSRKLADFRLLCPEHGHMVEHVPFRPLGAT